MSKLAWSSVSLFLGLVLGVYSMSGVAIKEINKTKEQIAQEEFSYSIRVFENNEGVPKEIFRVEDVCLVYSLPDFVLCKERGKDGKPDILLGQAIDKNHVVIISKIIRVEL